MQRHGINESSCAHDQRRIQLATTHDHYRRTQTRNYTVADCQASSDDQEAQGAARLNNRLDGLIGLHTTCQHCVFTCDWKPSSTYLFSGDQITHRLNLDWLTQHRRHARSFLSSISATNRSRGWDGRVRSNFSGTRDERVSVLGLVFRGAGGVLLLAEIHELADASRDSSVHLGVGGSGGRGFLGSGRTSACVKGPRGGELYLFLLLDGSGDVDRLGSGNGVEFLRSSVAAAMAFVDFSRPARSLSNNRLDGLLSLFLELKLVQRGDDIVRLVRFA